MDLKNLTIKPVENHEHLCWNCLGVKENIHEIEIDALGYGSIFDGFSTKLQLCNECYSETNPEWWKFDVIKTSPYEEAYLHEDDIKKFVESMPIQGRELFWNSCGSDKDELPIMDPQEWIDYNLVDENERYFYDRGYRAAFKEFRESEIEVE